MNIGQIEENVEKLIKNFSKEEFIYNLLLAYDLPKASITRLKEGAYNLSKNKSSDSIKAGREIIWKKKLYFKEVFDQDLHTFIDNLCRDEVSMKHSPRFMVVTDYKTLLAYDTKTKDTLDIGLNELPRYADFFLPWAGMEKAQAKLEDPADVKAAEKMAKLYDLIRQDNPDQFVDQKSLHRLNIFLSRLLFCYFAEDTEIFPHGLFTSSITSHTQEDGSDLDEYLDRLFDVMNEKDREGLPHYLKAFPYVNGGLFGECYKSPKFSPRSRSMLIKCGSELNWSDINPDIFGSMIQAVVHPDQRGGMGMHYTSVTNIMKVIEPLFLNELCEEFGKNKDSPQKLDKLLARLSMIRIFDPACGSGNFLIIAYKELRKLEIDILRQLKKISGAASGFDEVQKSLIPKDQLSFASSYMPSFLSRIQLSQFYGIELDDFAHEIAILSLWLAEHQMNVKFKEAFNQSRPSLPLKESGKIVCENAARFDWEKVCPKDNKAETYVLGNPPYLGARQQSREQKKDVEICLSSIKNSNNLDYITCWFMKGADFIKGKNSQFSFVSTNSICQGEQVASIWPNILKGNDLEISFAHQSFKWANNAKKNAGVTCVVIGIRNISKRSKFIFNNSLKHEASNVNAYLLDANNTYVYSRKTPLSSLPPINYGSFALDDGNYTLSAVEKDAILSKSPEAGEFIKEFIGAKEIIQGIPRFCLWVQDENLKKALTIPSIAERIKKVQKWRSESERENTKKLSNTPHLFAEIRQPLTSYWAFPTVSSERRKYIPVDLIEPDVIASNQVYIVPTPDAWVFGVLSSLMHMVWIKAVAGQLETRIRYSAAVCYNTFPIPNLSEKQKENIKLHALNVLEERETHAEKILADLYDPDKMPEGLRVAHEGLDQAVERCYRSKPFSNDEERLQYLFKLYEEMTSAKSEGLLNV